jgi:hypothetical protein
VVSKVIALVLLAVLAASVLWIGAEQHYRGCVEARFVTGAGTGAPLFSTGEPDTLHASIKGCKRSPF